ncbi:type IV pilin-like G/H family protein [Leptolyngbya boryana CZ1]|uniref:Type IV pilin-like G/H family protein n=1 Tax=Leptolyngbya boryana CZ1 TaxID=3060204 RepID=A0AA97ATA1_LEPBY|nr:type IV pilin-like G/H family protein [Leptolyngbya boryana]WNZ45490.1 type IV pilin-like G/H family protein [Leptolyngbya boryana CZ1]
MMKTIGWMSGLIGVVLISQSVMALPTTEAVQPSSIAGRWQGTFNDKYPMSFLFSPEGKLVMVFGMNGAEPTVLAGTTVNYKVDATTKPMHLDITIPDAKEPVLTIADLPDPQTLQIQMSDTNPGKPRPTKFTDQTKMQKVSDRAIEPLDAAKFTQAAQSSEAEGRIVIQALAQSALFSTVESGKFPTTLEELGLPTNNTANYRYQLQTQPKQITIIARPKKANLKSYISVVVTGTERKIDFATTTVCQSVRPSLFAPPPPRLGSPFAPNDSRAVCGIGSEAVKF